MGNQITYPSEVCVRAVRMVEEHRQDYPSRRATVQLSASKFGCASQTLHKWVKRAQIDAGERTGTIGEDVERFKALECENKELRRANEILRTASAFFAAAELDRKLKS